MRLIKIGIANLDPTVGAIESNGKKIIEAARKLAEENCSIIVFPEQAISAYPAEDLVQWKGFVEAQWKMLQKIAGALAEYPIILIVGLTVEESGNLYNTAALVSRGKILGLVPKEKLPTYGVFYEQRTFSPGIPGRVSEIEGIPFGDLIFRFPFGTVALEVCEDLWSSDGPMRRRAYSGAEFVINISASPWRADVLDTRRGIIGTRAADNAVLLLYVNQVGGNDSLVFDGGGFLNQGGKMIKEFPRWREGIDTIVIDLDRAERIRKENSTWRSDRKNFIEKNSPVKVIECNFPWNPLSDKKLIAELQQEKDKKLAIQTSEASVNPDFEDLIEAMIMGLKGYFEKTGAFSRIGIALSGGKDSALTLLVAYLYAKRKFGNDTKALFDFIHCFSLPTQFNSKTTKSIAHDLARELGVHFGEIPIEEEVAAMEKLLREMTEGTSISPVVHQNLQARIRGSAMWNWANVAQGLWLQTGNMSEKAVGYTTVGGDLMGGYSLIGNLPKSVLCELIRYIQARYFPSSLALPLLLETKASAELTENQEDEKDLMPFPILDRCYELFAGEKMMPLEVYQRIRAHWSDEELHAMDPAYTRGKLKEWVLRFVKLFRRSIFKWVQSPQTVHLGSLDLDRERALQLPVVQSEEWLLLKDLESIEE